MVRLTDIKIGNKKTQIEIVSEKIRSPSLRYMKTTGKRRQWIETATTVCTSKMVPCFKDKFLITLSVVLKYMFIIGFEVLLIRRSFLKT